MKRAAENREAPLDSFPQNANCHHRFQSWVIMIFLPLSLLLVFFFFFFFFFLNYILLLETVACNERLYVSGSVTGPPTNRPTSFIKNGQFSTASTSACPLNPISWPIHFPLYVLVQRNWHFFPLYHLVAFGNGTISLILGQRLYLHGTNNI